ncbi:MAG: hypothetical protein KF847_05580 [Pirellulales bacterium]|nr:hypothetical protein [Pirellulales bacterium]
MTTRSGRLSGGKSRPRRSLRRRGALRAAAARRRGVLLLVVLSMLVLFLLLGTAFVVSTKQDERTMKAQATAARVATAAASEGNLLDEVLAQLVRDTNNVHSSLRSHSLLADMYGNDGFTATLGQWPGNPPTLPVDWAGGDYARTGGQLIDLALGVNGAVTPNLPLAFTHYDKTNPTALSHLDDAYAGQVLTFLNGKAAGVSTRIVRYAPATYDNSGAVVTPPRLTVLEFKLADGRNLATATNNGAIPLAVALAPSAGLPLRVLVNGKPFSGTGVGYDPTHAPAANEPRGDAMELVAGVPRPLALLPNVAFFNPTGALNQIRLNNLGANNGTGEAYFPKNGLLPDNTTPTYAIDYAGRGGANESYDAPDFQNMFLAAMDLPGNGRLRESVGFSSAALNDMVLPSFHRPALLNYWKNQANSRNPFASNPLHLRKVLLRPNWLDHPNFTGSNPEYEAAKSVHANALNRMIYGPWDVDNDLDGVRDSVWVDFGAPVMQGVDGKRYKALAAILCLDLDGRANVNAAGSLDLAGVGSTPPRGRPVAGGGTLDDMPRGTGFGPADFSLQQIVGGDFERLLVGDRVNVSGQPTDFPGRYGYDNVATMPNNNARPGWPTHMDPLAQVARYGWPGNPRTQGLAPAGKFGTLPDLSARYAMGLNDLGQPVWGSTYEWGSQYTTVDSPYEINLSEDAPVGTSTAAADAPFTLFELERALRLYDVDAAGLPARFTVLAGIQNPDGSGDPYDRQRLTTISYDVPAPSVTVPKPLRTIVGQNVQNLPTGVVSRMPRNPAELFEIRVRRALGLPNNLQWPTPLTDANGATEAQRIAVRTVLRRIVAPELMAGGKINLNRPLGNGLDDNGNGVVDEPGEDVGLPYFDNNGDGRIDGADSIDQAFRSTVWPARAANSVPAYDGAADGMMIGYQGAQFAGAYDVSPNDGVSLTPADPRTLLARHLFVLALNTAAPDDYDPRTKAKDAALARQIAQWAINVVDFRDADNIMTAFEYDANPFDGWKVDDNPGTIDYVAGAPDNAGAAGDTVGGLVWGAERPELIISEQMAWHDRRTEDTRLEDPNQGEDAAYYDAQQALLDPKRYDLDYDQLTRPQGFWAIELYNPWEPSAGAQGDTRLTSTMRPGAMSVAQPGRDLGVNLAATSVANDPRRATPRPSPVWRIVSYRDALRTDPAGPTLPKDPDAQPPRGKDQLLRLTQPDRSVYFTGTAIGDPGYGDDGVAFFSSATNENHNLWVRPVRPGRYTVVTSGFRLQGGGDTEFVNHLGNFDGTSKEQGPGLRFRVGTGGLFGRPDNRPIEWLRNDLVGSLRSPTVSAAFDLQGFETGWPMADVAIIDSVDANSVYERNRNQRIPVTPSGNAIRRRLTLSEPALGYQRGGRYRDIGGNNDTQWVDADPVIRNQDQQARMQAAPRFPYHPEGEYQDGNGQSKPIDTPLDDPTMRYDGETRLATRGLITNYQWIYLQRLANPLLPWNPAPGTVFNAAGVDQYRNDMVVNPYLTIDDNSANLFVFNGVKNQNSNDTGAGEQFNPTFQPPKHSSQNEAAVDFASMERGWSQDPQQNRLNNVLQNVNPWLSENPWVNGRPRARPGGTARVGAAAASPPPFRGKPRWSMGYLNESFDRDDNGNGVVPDQPFPMMAWNNRPYQSEAELMLVPAQRSSQLLRSTGVVDTASTARTDQAWPYAAATPIPISRYTRADQPNKYGFGYTLNFFYEGQGGGIDPQPTPTPPANTTFAPAGMAAMLDLVEVKSEFAGTDTWLNPQKFSVANPQATPSYDDVIVRFMAPNNSVSNQREPGKINLNTINSFDVYRGLFHAITRRTEAVRPDVPPPVHPGPWWRPWMPGTDEDQARYEDKPSFVSSRRGYSVRQLYSSDLVKLESDMQPFVLDPNLPTFFANPFRSVCAHDLVPLTQMLRFAPSEVGLIRSENVPAVTTASGIVDNSLMNATNSVLLPKGLPLLGADAKGTNAIAARNAGRSSYFHFQPMNRLASMTTTRSNCYAVWVTIGFFEVEDFEAAPASNTPDRLILNRFGTGAGTLADASMDPLFKRVYPDGVKFGREIGLDTGEVRRLRGFYVIDRSRPAAFEPGVDHNVENVVRLKRRIE